MKNRNGLCARERRLYNIWLGMLRRCENPEQSSYERYGGRGISVCEQWHDFDQFVTWAHEYGYDDSLTIDRINNDGNYEPSNCRWATAKEQANNKSSNVILIVGGIKGTATQLARLIGVSEHTVHYWVRNRGKESTSERIAEAIKTGDFYSIKSVEKTCVKCGKKFNTTPGKACAKYCDKCKAIAERAKVDRYQKRKLEEKTVEKFSVTDEHIAPYSNETVITKRHYRKLKSGYCYLGTARISNAEYDEAKQEWENQQGKAVER